MYEDGFYIPANIIGFTGDLFNSPTVYFQNGHVFGRITQHHDNPNNVGRNVVRFRADYRIVNQGGQANEIYDGGVRHSSRNAFEQVNPATRRILATAINRFPNVKPRFANLRGRSKSF